MTMHLSFRSSLRALACVLAATLAASSAPAADKSKSSAKTVPLKSDAWAQVSKQPITSQELDRLIQAELEQAKIQPAPLTTDEQFLRRVTLDVTGRLPSPADIDAFVKSDAPNKRAQKIDQLLESDAYARHWAQYWREVFERRLTDPRGRIFARAFEDWMADELKANHSWGEITRTILTAGGELRFDQPRKNASAFLMASRRGNDAANELAAEVSRVFLGIQIQCAQCHNHPYDQWKQVQFHELAAYFARLRERPIRDKSSSKPRLVGFELISARQGEHQMPNREDPKKNTTVYPRFLDGQSPGKNLGDRERRAALADAIVDKDNFWFSAAYVNRVWGELMGQSFYTPVDDMGPQREAVMREVLVRLASSFRATDYDTQALLRVVLNTTTYQRQLRPGETGDEHLRFAATYPKRLSSAALWESLVGVLGTFGPAAAPVRPGARRGAGRFGMEKVFEEKFAFDPSLKSDEIEGSIPQALMLMNNPAIHRKIEARGSNFLAELLKSHSEDDDALRQLYLRALARKPTDREMQKCRNYITKASSRSEAFEDILWALVNSTEFQTRR